MRGKHYKLIAYPKAKCIYWKENARYTNTQRVTEKQIRYYWQQRANHKTRDSRHFWEAEKTKRDAWDRLSLGMVRKQSVLWYLDWFYSSRNVTEEIFVFKKAWYNLFYYSNFCYSFSTYIITIWCTQDVGKTHLSSSQRLILSWHWLSLGTAKPPTC